MNRKKLFATMIGINYYPITPLTGCINDVLKMDSFLNDFCKQQNDGANNLLEYKPLYMLAPTKTDELSIATYESGKNRKVKYEAPTFKNVTEKAFKHLKKAKSGDICVFYYSGHGSRVKSPVKFWLNKSDRMNETIVCSDSRDEKNPDSRDLIDKEIAYLLWDALEGKDVHCLVIMDCCYSGDNTKEMDVSTTIGSRNIPSSRNEVPIEKYIGFQQGFFKKGADDVYKFNVARYVQLGACSAYETALEKGEGGFFTNQLITSLGAGGANKTYRDLMQSVGLGIKLQRKDQNPVWFARNEEDGNLLFLGQQFLPYQPSYQVYFNTQEKNWVLNAGKMDGLSASNATSKTTVLIPELNIKADVVTVLSDRSLLDKTVMTNVGPQKLYDAKLISLAAKKTVFGVDKSLAQNPEQLKELRIAYEKTAGQLMYSEINFDSDNGDYLIRLTKDKQYIMTQQDSAFPLAKRVEAAAELISYMDAVGKWAFASQLEHQSVLYKPDDFEFTIEKIDGQEYSVETLDLLEGEKSTGPLPPELTFSYKDGHEPLFRLMVAIKNPKIKFCYARALYLRSDFGIITDMIPDGNDHLIADGDPITLSAVSKQGFQVITFPLRIANEYLENGINEITAILKIIISGRRIEHVDRFKQDRLPLDSGGEIHKRNFDVDSASTSTEWTVFTTRIRIVAEEKQQRLIGGVQDATFGGVTVQAPAGITANAYFVSADDFQTIGAKGLPSDADTLRPPAELFEGLTVSDGLTQGGLVPGANNNVWAIELQSVDGQPIRLEPGQFISIKTTPGEATRDISTDEEDAVALTYGYDDDSQLYLPLGYEDENGETRIYYLPSMTNGLLQNGENTKGIGKSLKLFFKKIFHPKQTNRLCLYKIDPQNNWIDLGDDAKRIKKELKGKPDNRVILLIHGYTGNTEHMIKAFQALDTLGNIAPYVLTFDYESLATSIDTTASKLHGILSGIGYDTPDEMPKLTIVAHSMGGMVSRFMIDKYDGHTFVQRAILIGVGNAGSELPGLAKSVFGMISHALNVNWMGKLAIKGLTLLLRKLQLDPGTALREMEVGSDRMKELSALVPRTDYRIIAGDIAKLKELGFDGHDKFLEKVVVALRNNVIHPVLQAYVFDGEPNDGAVARQSMASIINLDIATHLVDVTSNHLGYFRQKRCQNELLAWLNKQV